MRVAGRPTRGRARGPVVLADEGGRFNFGSFRESENAALAARGLEVLGLRIAMDRNERCHRTPIR